MSHWSPAEIQTLRSTHEIRVAGLRTDGSPRSLVTIWGVVVDDALYVRSYNGVDGSWYRSVTGAGRDGQGVLAVDGDLREVRYLPDATRDDDIDEAYLGKYGRNVYSRAMVAPSARATTLRVEPR